MTSETERKAPLSRGICMGWGLGTLGPVTVLTASNVLLLRYLTDHVGIAAALASSLIAFSKLLDAFLDPTMGWLSDRTRSRMGRRRPYLLAGGVLLALSVVGLFSVPDIADYDLRAVYVGAVLVFYALAYTVFNIPYLSMPAEMTTDYHERSYIMSFRVYAVGLSTIAASVLGPMVLAALGGGSDAYAKMALVFVPLILLSAWICFRATRHAPFTAKPDSTHYPILYQVKSVASNKPFLVLIVIKFLTLMALGVQSVFAFFFTYVLKVSDVYLGQYFLCSSLAMILSQPLWLRLSRWSGSKRNTYIAALALSLPAYLSWLWAEPGQPVAFIFLRAAVIGAAGGGAILMGQSLLPDTMEYDYLRTGLRREGLFAGFYTTVEKLSGAIGIAVVGAVLGSAGYVQSMGSGVTQPQSAIDAIYWVMCFLPALISLLGIVALLFYRLTETSLKATTLLSPIAAPTTDGEDFPALPTT
ncbi:MFS transporter [Novosphingobium sp. BL-52-GroH]|uniref:MFS transporter n=1 Tax=Novosphingobium sp. BL-52-GroH TaxID=3349877 RepID=UPI00384D759D